jgi:hypothetical protein
VERAAAGAVVYASYFVGEHRTQRGPWWPKLDETFGVVKQLRYGLVDPIEDDSVRMVFQRDFGGIGAGEELVFRVGGTAESRAFLPVVPNGAEVIAVDGRGRPALLRHRVGDGWMVLCTYPVEHMAAMTPRVNPEPTWRLYAALASAAGVPPSVSVDDPLVLTGLMEHSVDGRVFAWFISQHASPVEVEPVVADGVLVALDGSPLASVELGAYGVLVAEVREVRS